MPAANGRVKKFGHNFQKYQIILKYSMSQIWFILADSAEGRDIFQKPERHLGEQAGYQ